jgi:hypothetical protein
MGIEIRRVTAEQERDAVARLRYEVLVAESAIHVHGINHRQRTIRDALDDGADLFAAIDSDDGKFVGSIRSNQARRADLGPYVAQLGMKEFGDFFPTRVALISRLVALPTHRTGTVVWRLLEAGFRCQIDQGIAFSFAECRPDRRDWAIARLGYRQVFPAFRDPIDGLHYPLVLLLEDHNHLDRIGSPMRRLVHTDDSGSVPFFEERFGRKALMNGHSRHAEASHVDDCDE